MRRPNVVICDSYGPEEWDVDTWKAQQAVIHWQRKWMEPLGSKALIAARSKDNASVPRIKEPVFISAKDRAHLQSAEIPSALQGKAKLA